MNFNELTSAENAAASRDLDWLAFRYVAGEMDADETAQFEGCLAEEQVAREAVAAAVILLQAVPLAAGDEQRTGQESPATVVAAPQGEKVHSWRQRLAWAGVGAAASAAVLLATTGNHPTRHRSDRLAGVATAANSDVDNLAVTWSSLADDESDSPADASSDDATAPSTQPADVDATGSTQDIVEQLSAPGWLIAAVAPEEMPQDGETHDVDLD